MDRLSGGRPYGIGSPIEQNRKHIAVLGDVFASGLVDLPRRAGIASSRSIGASILVSKEARISRPKTKEGRASVNGLEGVVKVDQLKSVIDRDSDSRGFRVISRIVGKGEVERFARQVAGLHRPEPTDWAAKFGLRPMPEAPPVAAAEPPAPEPPTAASTCEACGRPVSQAVVDFCAARADVFGGRTLCMDCQRIARRGRAGTRSP